MSETEGWPEPPTEIHETGVNPPLPPMPPTDYGPEPVPPTRSFARRVRTPLIMIVVALLVGFAGGFVIGHRNSSASPTPVAATPPAIVPASTPTVTPTDSAPATAPATPVESAVATPSDAATSGAPTSPATTGVVGTVSLVNLTPTSSTFDNPDKSPMVNGQPQLLSISQYIGGNTCYSLVTSGTAGYNLSRDYTKFTALIGIDDASPDATLRPTVEIDGDGLKLAVYTPKLGHPVSVSLDVTNVLRLDIKWTDPAARCGASYLVVANGQLTTIPGYTPPAHG